MARTDTLGNFLTDVADAIREKKGTTELIPASAFDTEIDSISGGVDINDYYLTSVTTSGNINIKSYIKKIPLIEAPNKTNLYGFFQGCIALTTIPLIDTSAATNMNSMFQSCVKLISIPQLDTSKVTSMGQMFYDCRSLTTIPQLDTSNVTDMSSMFAYCHLLTTIPQLDLSKVTTVDQIFYSCSALTTLGGFQNLGMAYDTNQSANYGAYKLDLSVCKKLTHDSLMNVINGLYDIKTKGCNPQQLILGSTNLEKLTAEEIAIATNKGFNVS